VAMVQQTAASSVCHSQITIDHFLPRWADFRNICC
jgi:hypothetical protein